MGGLTKKELRTEKDLTPKQKMFVEIMVRDHGQITQAEALKRAGYDCKDAYFLQEKNSNLLNFIGYKNSDDTYEPDEVTVYDLLEMDRLPNSMIQQMKKFGYISNKNLLLSWMDGTLIDYSSI